MIFWAAIVIFSGRIGHAVDVCTAFSGSSPGSSMLHVSASKTIQQHQRRKGLDINQLPPKGFGTAGRLTGAGEALLSSLKTYLAHGGRLIDTAVMYGNHGEVATAIKESGVPREEIWVTTKLMAYQIARGGDDDPRWQGWCSHPSAYQGSDNLDDLSQTDIGTHVDVVLNRSLSELGLDYIDLVLIHQPWDVTIDEAIWSSLRKAKRSGLINHIGVSDMGQEFIEDHTGGELPEVLQVLHHPWSPPEMFNLVQWCLQHGIRVTAFGSLGGSKYKLDSEEKPTLESVHQLGQKYGATSGQILLRWALDQGLDVIPGSDHHIEENLDLDFFHLTSAEIQQITSEAQKQTRTWYEQER